MSDLQNEVNVSPYFPNVVLAHYHDYVVTMNAYYEYCVQSLWNHFYPFNYLNGKRKFTAETISELGMGYAPGDNTLLTFLEQRNISISKLEELGILLNVGENGKEEWYDIFTNRIMFPIFNLQGGVTGFTARVWIDTQDTKAKYKNSVLSPVFQKSHVIYNLYHALPYIKQLNYAIIVEGATDVAKMWQYGIRNVIAPCGTALMLQHIIILKYFTPNIITIFDTDAAGYQALKRVENLFNETNTKFRKLDLWKIPSTSKTDPDSYLEHFGAQAFYQQLQQLFNNWG